MLQINQAYETSPPRISGYKLLVWYILRDKIAEGQPAIKQQEIADIAGLSLRTIQTHISSMADDGLVCCEPTRIIQNRRGWTYRYSLVDDKAHR